MMTDPSGIRTHDGRPGRRGSEEIMRSDGTQNPMNHKNEAAMGRPGQGTSAKGRTGMEGTINVLLVDDHEMVRMGLSAYLSTEPDIVVVGEACNGVDACEKALRLLPDVILMDLVMDGMNGIEATRRITEAFEANGHDVRIIILTSFIEEDKVLPALEAGAFSYLLKTTKAQDIVRAIRKAKEGESILEGKVGQVVMQSRRRKMAKHDALTEREMEILKEIGKGKTNKEIAETLFIGIKTVKTHVSSILAKLELEDRTKAAVYANQHKLI
jgi:two-component system, NarL family, response regulator LiaR